MQKIQKEKKLKSFSRYLLLVCTILVATPNNSEAQAVPSREENIPFLITFGNSGLKSWGDDDHMQVFYFVLPKKHNKPFYIRVFDPNVGGKHDEQKSAYNSTTKFQVYGGKGCVTSVDKRKNNPEGDHEEGVLLASKSFGAEAQYDDTWYSFGPFDPASGEFAPSYGGYVFKIVCKGVSGDDGNLYKYFMSTAKDKNIQVEGGNAFTFEYSFRLHADANQTSHIYPFLDKHVVSMKQSNFDWDNDGVIRIISKGYKGKLLKTSGDNKWARSTLKVAEVDKNSSADIQFIKSKEKNIRNNNVVFNVTNQFGEYMPFYSVPIGGVPKYAYNIGYK